MVTAQLKTIKGEVSSEIVEKKSRFIAHLCHVDNEKEALDFIAKIKKEHSQAKHNVYAYIVLQQSQSSAPSSPQTTSQVERIRFSDDGEPSRTAGKPTLDALKFGNLTNVACVVTRYFGGVLLGTGGLVRAYSTSVKNAIQNAEIIDFKHYEEKDFECDYADFEAIKKNLEKDGGKIKQVFFESKVKITALLPL